MTACNVMWSVLAAVAAAWLLHRPSRPKQLTITEWRVRMKALDQKEKHRKCS